MKNAIEFPDHKWRPSKGDSITGGSGPASLLDAVSSITGRSPLGLVTPGLGFDVLDIVEMGVDLIQDPAAFGMDLLRDALGEGLLGLSDLVGGVVEGIFDFIDDFGPLLSAAWDLLKEIPVLGDYLASVEQILDNLLDTLWYELTGSRSDLSDPGPGDVQCLGDIPTSYGDIDYQKFKELTGGREIALEIKWLLQHLMPKVYSFNDDAPALDWSEFDLHAWQDGSTWDIDDDFARDPDQQQGGRPWVKAWKISKRRIMVEVGQLRAVSFWPCSRADGELVFEHEGDGERFFMHIQVDPTDKSDPDGSARAVARLTGLVGWGHGSPYYYTYDELRLDGDRATVSVARGSHSVSIVQGPANSGGSIFFFSTDYYPGPGTDGASGPTTFGVATSLSDICGLYANGQTWGKAKGMFGATNYPSWGSACGYTSKKPPRSEADFVAAFTLVPVEADRARCPKGDACGGTADCPNFADPGDDGPDAPQVFDSPEEFYQHRASQTENDLRYRPGSTPLYV